MSQTDKPGTPRTDAILRDLVKTHGRGEYADAHIIEDFTDFARTLERELAAAEQRAQESAKDAERLRGGLRWYADGHHYFLENWEDCSGESANWIFPPMDVTDKSWIVDDGGIARSILDHGHAINPNHAEDDNITIAPDAAIAKDKP